ncbi:MAG: spermidine/putrescine ABC transporter substrate-binding protein [Myxococcales bacterium]|nr:spermidine/putrescine ABC transporter substrate-binding protein [Myxococcota bacterium]MDW8283893.1 spermidine/putrescine ABC transporter substrate-binding protein [Myxococcales bacterium]
MCAPQPWIWSVLLALVSCTEGRRGGAPPSKPSLAGQTLRLYNFPNYLGRHTVSTFQEHTGARVVVETYASNEELVRALEAGARHDVVFPSSYAADRLIRRGLLRPLDRDRVPNLIQVPERFRNPPVDPGLRHCVPYTWALVGLGLRSPRNRPGLDPDSLSALFAEHGPPVLMLDDMRATLGMALRYLGLSASTRSADDLARARNLLLGQARRVVRYVADAGPPLADREAMLALAWSGDVAAVARTDREVRFVVPREGTLLYLDYACVPRTAPSPQLAFAFLNHLLEPQIAADLTNSLMFPAPNDGARKLLSPQAQWLWGLLEAVRDQGRLEMIRDVDEAQPLYEAVWQQVRSRVEARR